MRRMSSARRAIHAHVSTWIADVVELSHRARIDELPMAGMVLGHVYLGD